MEDNFEKRLSELYNRTMQKSYANFTAFLTAEEKARALLLPFTTTDNCMFFGGYDDAERTLAGFFPDYLCGSKDDKIELFPLRLLKIEGSGYRKLTHRDFLGSILSLGIKREFVGDIVCTKDGFCGYVFVHESIADFVLNSLEKIANDKVSVKELALSELPAMQKDYKSITDVVMSLRLDAIVSAALNISREKSERAICQGLVSINHIECTKKDKTVNVGDLISIKGSGRFLLNDSVHNKKGKLRIDILKYL